MTEEDARAANCCCYGVVSLSPHSAISFSFLSALFPSLCFPVISVHESAKLNIILLYSPIMLDPLIGFLRARYWPIN
jgi:hypothetical protein